MLCCAQGIVLKPRFSRGTHTFDFPVLLSHDPRAWRVLLGAYVLPPLAIYVAKRHVIRPLRRWLKTRQVNSAGCLCNSVHLLFLVVLRTHRETLFGTMLAD